MIKKKSNKRATPMQKLYRLLPLRLGTLFEIRRLTWLDFKGDPNQQQPWSAHTYWHVKYQFEDGNHLRPKINVEVTPKSWVKPHKKCPHLLNHEQGHYLIGCLCALQFLRRLHREQDLSESQVADLFARTHRQYLEMELRYDGQTDHRLNFEMQQVWDLFFINRVNYYAHIYDPKENRLLALRQRV